MRNPAPSLLFVSALLLFASYHAFAASLLRKYSDLSLAQIEQQLLLLAQHTALLRVTDASAAFALQPVSWKGVSCSPLIARLTQQSTLQRDAERPQVLLSGALHGDERVGPAVVTETIRLLVHAHLCDAPVHERADVSGTNLDGVCEGVDARTRDWLSHLLATRDIIALPAANCVGYALRERTEKRIDPNRDFPFEQSPSRCMQTTTARVLNEVWRSNLIQLAVTFHGGMEAISWVWGSPSHPAKHDISPDDHSQSQLGRALHQAAGKTAWGTAYQFGRMSSLVYPVAGGMEDWAYGTGWAHTQSPCKAEGYAAAHTTYAPDAPNFRTAIYLVESSNQKSPPNHKYGRFEDLFSSNNNGGGGHVSRDLKLTLMALEMAQPYVCLDSVILRQGASPALNIAWFVGGALTVDETFLTLQPIPTEMSTRCGNNCTSTELRKILSASVRPTAQHDFADGWKAGRVARISRKFSGYGWKNPILLPKNSTNAGGFPSAPSPSPQSQSLFSTTVRNLGAKAEPGDYWIVAWTRTDQSWSNQAAHAQPAGPPQTHLANARTNPKWSFVHGDRVVNGRLYWPSAPLAVRVTESRNVEILSWMLRCRHSRSA